MPHPPAKKSAAKGVYLQTFGCQMNVYDSAKLLEQLRAEDYVPVDSPRDAELIIVNTCAIREKAEHKVYSLLGGLGGLKQSRPQLKIAVSGCVAQQRGEAILKRVPEVDLVFGPDNLFDLPRLMREVEAGQRPVSTEWRHQHQRVANFIPDFNGSAQPAGELKAGLAITKGCNNFCTFCVVPYTRGREVSREPENIAEEAQRMVAQGTREITLLGQNVNSYKASGVSFVGLLERLHEIDGLERLRYTSPHPKDFDDTLIEAHATLPKLCEHVHLPFQSGSDRILKAMRRNHTIKTYLGKLARLKARLPEIALSTDVIVGFPGESEADFEATLDVLNEVGFDQVYAFKFSPRSDTPAAKYEGQVSERVKSERLARLFEVHERMVEQGNRSLIGTRQEVLVEGPHSRDPSAATGRSRGNKSVMIMGAPAIVGALMPVEIVAARRFSLMGREVTP